MNITIAIINWNVDDTDHRSAVGTKAVEVPCPHGSHCEPGNQS
jgi:hypothetical protein